jgi:hypothetical protein
MLNSPSHKLKQSSNVEPLGYNNSHNLSNFVNNFNDDGKKVPLLVASRH